MNLWTVPKTITCASMDIPAALRILRDARLEVLRHHTSDTLSTLREVQRRLNDLVQHGEPEAVILPACRRCQGAVSYTSSEKNTQSTSPTPYPSVTPSPCLANNHSHNDEGTRRSGPKPRSHIRRPLKTQSENDRNSHNRKRKISSHNRSAILFEALIAELRSAWNLVGEHTPENVYQTQQQYRRDRRLDDILRVDGIQHPTAIDKLFRGVAQRSLAMQYSKYQHSLGQKPRVEELCDYLNNQDPGGKGKLHRRRGGGIASWVRQHLDYEEKKEKVATECVSSGIKQLVVEKLLEKRLQGAGQTTKSSGISALTALTITPFRALHLEDIPSFVDHVFSEPSNNNLPVTVPQGSEKTGCNLLYMVGKFSQWFEAFQNSYDKGNSSLTETSQEFELPSPNHSLSVPPDASEALPGCKGDMDHQRELALERQQTWIEQQICPESSKSAQKQLSENLSNLAPVARRMPQVDTGGGQETFPDPQNIDNAGSLSTRSSVFSVHSQVPQSGIYTREHNSIPESDSQNGMIQGDTAANQRPFVPAAQNSELSSTTSFLSGVENETQSTSDFSTSSVDANQTKWTQGETFCEGRRHQGDSLVSVPLDASLCSPRYTDTGRKRRRTDTLDFSRSKPAADQTHCEGPKTGADFPWGMMAQIDPHAWADFPDGAWGTMTQIDPHAWADFPDGAWETMAQIDPHAWADFPDGAWGSMTQINPHAWADFPDGAWGTLAQTDPRMGRLP